MLAGMSVGRLRTAVDENLLGVIGTAETIGIIVVIGDAEVAGMAISRIAPLIGAVGTTRVEAVIIGLVGIAAIFPLKIAGKCATHRAPDHDACDRCPRPPPPAPDRVAQQ